MLSPLACVERQAQHKPVYLSLSESICVERQAVLIGYGIGHGIKFPVVKGLGFRYAALSSVHAACYSE